MSRVSARSPPQVLSVKDECAFGFSNFLIIGLSNHSANSWFYIIYFFNITNISFLLNRLIDHWSKSTLISIVFWISAIWNILSCHTLSAAVRLFKFSKSP